MFTSKAGTTAPLYVLRELAHRFVRDRTALAPSQRGLGLIHRYQNFGASALAFFPEGKRFLHRIFFVPEATALDGSTNKCLLVGCKVNFHTLRVGGKNVSVKHLIILISRNAAWRSQVRDGISR